MLNHVSFQGRFVDDPKFGKTNSGVDYANFRLAWSEKYRDKEAKCFLDCKAFGNTAAFMQKYMNRKGQEILAEGKLNTDEWQDQEGNKRSKIALVVGSVHFCGKREDGAPAAPAAEAEVPVNMTPVETDELPFDNGLVYS